MTRTLPSCRAVDTGSRDAQLQRAYGCRRRLSVCTMATSATPIAITGIAIDAVSTSVSINAAPASRSTMAAASTTRSTRGVRRGPPAETSFTDSTLFPATKHLGSAPHRHPNRRGTLLPETTNPAGFPLPWCQCGKASSPTTRNSASSQTPRVARTNTDRSSRRMIATVANAPPTITVARPPRTPKSDTGRGLRDAFGMRIRSQTIPASSGLTGAVQRFGSTQHFGPPFSIHRRLLRRSGHSGVSSTQTTFRTSRGCLRLARRPP